MKKNVASQVIGAQMVSATDGSAFTSTVTVRVTGDGGTQALGSVGSGVCTHEGNGFHTYAPAQAETNYDHVAFTFTGTGAIPQTLQIFTNFPQTGDAKTDTAAILIDTNELQTDWVNGGRLDVILDARASQTSVDTVDDFLDTEIAAIKAKTDNLPSDPADESLLEAAITAATSPLATAAALTIVDDFLDTEIAAIKAKTDNLPAAPAATSDIPSAATVAAAVLTAATANPIDANVQEINDVALTGDGSTTPWGPA